MRFAVSVVVGMSAILFSSCTKTANKGAVPADQIVAHIGEDVVSKSEFENELHLSNIPVDRQTDPAAMKRVLGDLVLRKYLAQNARRLHLDQKPSLVMNINRAQEQVLASAVIATMIADKPLLEVDIAKYIKDNPARFAERQLFILEQISLEVGANSQVFIDANKAAKSLDEIDGRLALFGVPHSRSVVMVGSDDIPDEINETLQSRGDAEVLFTRSGNKATYISAHKARYPLEGEAAAVVARQALRNERIKADLVTVADAAAGVTKYERQYNALMNAKVPAPIK
ncbi:MAG TPA: hypothetical protein VKG63_07650 [Steroidobacteraceae bacterium]|nr:hypothetical protein [Steroidobacteraceae bacterium]